MVIAEQLGWFWFYDTQLKTTLNASFLRRN